MMQTVARRATQRHTGAANSWNRQKSSGPSSYGNTVCRFWMAGKCSRNPCRFAHTDKEALIRSGLRVNGTSFKQSPAPLRQLNTNVMAEKVEFNGLKRIKKRPLENEVEVSEYAKSRGNTYHADNTSPTKRAVRLNRSVFDKTHKSPRLYVGNRDSKDMKASSVIEVRGCDPTYVGSKYGPSGASNATNGDVKEVNCTKICEDWVNKSCFRGEECKLLHSWCYGDGFFMLSQLEGHNKAVTGITLPLGSDKLITGSKDGTIRIWNCHTGECVGVADVGAPVECLISEGPWVFVGLINAVKVWNVQTNAEFILTSQAGRVYSMVAINGMLLAGVEDGSILAWKFDSGAASFVDMAPLKGHTNAVVSLTVGDKVGHKLFSGSLDNTIRVWDLDTMQCINSIAKHTDVVMSLLCWEEYLLSCSLDHTLKIWAPTQAGRLEATYEHKEGHGILSLCGMHDAANKPILLCSCNDNTVRMYELPSFAERGKIFAKQEVRAIYSGPGGLFFTGDGTGMVSVWKCSS